MKFSVHAMEIFYGYIDVNCVQLSHKFIVVT